MTKFEGVKKACIAISRANGGINRGRSEEEVVKEYETWVFNRWYSSELPKIDAWLLTLNDDQMQLVTDGDFDDAKELMESAPPFTERLLSDFFEDVC